MEQGLTLGLQQKLVMTQQLRQAIHILQLSAQELSSLIETEFLENPALEMESPPEMEVAAAKEEKKYEFEELGALARYLEGSGSDGQGVNYDQEHDGFEARAAAKPSLLQMLEVQVDLNLFDDVKRRVAMYIIGCIDGNGYLTCTVKEIAESLNVTERLTEEVLCIVQGFEPDGIGARDLRECLTIQARQQGIFSGLVAKIISLYLDEIADKRYKVIAAKESCSIAEVQSAAEAVRKLNPKPGLGYFMDEAEYIVPDVSVRKINGEFIIIINDYGVPRLSINAAYRRSEHFDADTKKYIEGRVNAAAWLLKSIEQRRATLYNVMEAIVGHQKDFFERGHKYLRPLQMKSIADQLGIHESTVSRTVANKYAQTPFGCIALKSFFRANLAQSGEELIAGQVQEAIKKLVKEENPHKPLSDQQISDMLKKDAMKISRRTVTKYRELMGIASSSKRKVYES